MPWRRLEPLAHWCRCDGVTFHEAIRRQRDDGNAMSTRCPRIISCWTTMREGKHSLASVLLVLPKQRLHPHTKPVFRAARSLLEARTNPSFSSPLESTQRNLALSHTLRWTTHHQNSPLLARVPKLPTAWTTPTTHSRPSISPITPSSSVLGRILTVTSASHHEVLRNR